MSEATAAGSTGRDALQDGDRVELHSLQAKPEYNGKAGTLVAFDAVSGQEWVFEVAQFQREIDAWRQSVAALKSVGVSLTEAELSTLMAEFDANADGGLEYKVRQTFGIRLAPLVIVEFVEFSETNADEGGG